MADNYYSNEATSPRGEEEGSPAPGTSPTSPSQSKRMKWTEGLHQLFVKAVNTLGHQATPARIQKEMNVSSLTLRQISSHLQKYKIEKALKKSMPKLKIKDQTALISARKQKVTSPTPPRKQSNSSPTPLQQQATQVATSTPLRTELIVPPLRLPLSPRKGALDSPPSSPLVGSSPLLSSPLMSTPLSSPPMSPPMHSSSLVISSSPPVPTFDVHSNDFFEAMNELVDRITLDEPFLY